MAKEQKQELAVIDFEKFSVAQLPELKGKKEEIKSIIDANPIVEIVDNATYESAKKSRTAVKTLRTRLEKEQKDVKKKIKEHVLDVVDKEYDTIVLGVKSAEKERQDPIDVWETKKEEERKEKARLEELRIKQIKDAIQTFKDAWIETVGQMTFERIENFNEMFEKYSSEFDREKLAEYEVLFDDALLVIRQLADSKIKTLTEQEQIRIDNLLIEEKNAETKRIQEWQRVWNANIDTLSFDDIKDVKSVLAKSKLANLKHYSSEYEEIFTSTEKRLHSQIEFVSKAEEQRIAQEKFAKEQAEIAEKNRIAQEKFLAEKKEFEEKQRKAKIEQRTSIFKSLGLEFGNFHGASACYGNQKLNLFYPALYITDAPDDRFEEVVLEIKEKIAESTLKTKEPVVAERVFESEPIASSVQKIEGNQIVYADYHESDVDEKGVVKTHEESAPIIYKAFGDQSEKVLENIKNKTHEISDFKEEQIPTKSEVTWKGILEQFNESGRLRSATAFIDWLQENYNVPTKK